MQIAAREIQCSKRIDDGHAETLPHEAAHGDGGGRLDHLAARDARLREGFVDLNPVWIVRRQTDEGLIREVLQIDYALGEQWMPIGQHTDLVYFEQGRQACSSRWRAVFGQAEVIALRG